MEATFDSQSLFSKPAKERLSKKRDQILAKLLVKKNPLSKDQQPNLVQDESEDIVEQAFSGENDKAVLDTIRRDFAAELSS